MATKRTAVLPRTGLNPNPRDLRRRARVDHEVLPHRAFFVPSFCVRRQLIPDDAAIEFHERLTDFCKRKPYEPRPLGRIGISLVEKSRFEGCFLRADVQPDVDDMFDLAVNVRDVLAARVKSEPRTLHVPIGSVAVFGAQNNEIALVLKAGRGLMSAMLSATTTTVSIQTLRSFVK